MSRIPVTNCTWDMVVLAGNLILLSTIFIVLRKLLCLSSSMKLGPAGLLLSIEWNRNRCLLIPVKHLIPCEVSAEFRGIKPGYDNNLAVRHDGTCIVVAKAKLSKMPSKDSYRYWFMHHLTVFLVGRRVRSLFHFEEAALNNLNLLICFDLFRLLFFFFLILHSPGKSFTFA